jgi:hypothetical protein
MADWLAVDTDPFAVPSQRPPPRTSLTISPDAPQPPVQPDAPRVPSPTNWAPVEHAPEFTPREEPKQEPAAERPGFWESAASASRTFANDLHRQRAAASQGTTPNLAAHEENLISDNVMEGDDGNLHYVDSEGRLQPTDTNKHVALPGDDGRIRLYARTPSTDEGRLSSAGRLLMTGMQTETPRFGTAAPIAGTRVLGIGSRSPAPAVHPGWLPPPSTTEEAIAAANRQGIKLPQAIASENRNINFLGQVLTKAPGGSPLQSAIEQGLQGEEGLAGALKRTGAATGGVADVKQAGEGVTTGIENVFVPESQKLVKQLYEHVDKLVDPAKTAPLSETQKTVGDILARRMARGNDENGAAVNMVAGALQRRGGLTYEALKDLRTDVREVKQKGDTGGLLPPGMSQRELNDIYTALTKDLGNATEITGGPAARTAWERANMLSKDRKDVLETLNKVIGPKTRSDEGTMEAVHRMLGTGAGADIETATTLRKALQGVPGILPGKPGAWENVASTVISRLGKNSQGEFSPALFIRDYGELSPAGKRLLFQGVGKGDLIGALDDIATVSDKYVKAGKLGNPSGSAGHAALIGAISAGAAALMSGNVATPIGIAAAVLGSNVTSRLLGSPATAASVARWSRAVDNLAQTPGYRTWAAYNIASRNLANTGASAAGDPSLAPRLQQQLQGAMRRPDERPNQTQQ